MARRRAARADGCDGCGPAAPARGECRAAAARAARELGVPVLAALPDPAEATALLLAVACVLARRERPLTPNAAPPTLVALRTAGTRGPFAAELAGASDPYLAGALHLLAPEAPVTPVAPAVAVRAAALLAQVLPLERLA